MSAGTGIRHSEVNASATERVHLLQIWIMPHTGNLPPGYEQKAIDPARSRNAFGLIAAPDGRDGAVTLAQDARLWLARLAPGAETGFALEAGRGGWLQIAGGDVTADGHPLHAGDGAGWTGTDRLRLVAQNDAEILLFDLD
jgi:redox-sensitive bicupin YhaK (pirin superfamily)